MTHAAHPHTLARTRIEQGSDAASWLAPNRQRHKRGAGIAGLIHATHIGSIRCQRAADAPEMRGRRRQPRLPRAAAATRDRPEAPTPASAGPEDGAPRSCGISGFLSGRYVFVLRLSGRYACLIVLSGRYAFEGLSGRYAFNACGTHEKIRRSQWQAPFSGDVQQTLLILRRDQPTSAALFLGIRPLPNGYGSLAGELCDRIKAATNFNHSGCYVSHTEILPIFETTRQGKCFDFRVYHVFSKIEYNAPWM